MRPMSTRHLRGALALACLATALPAQTPEPTDERLREAWSYLLPEEREEVGEWFRAEVGYLDLYVNKMIAYVLAGQDRDRGMWPAPEPAPCFDPKEHCPAQPIARTPLRADSSELKRARKRMLPSADVDGLHRVWSYDWTTGDLVMSGDERDPEPLFENALQGYPPLLDLAEALVLRRLDDGAQRAALTAFAHTYTDRSGNVFVGITLYDAWASGAEIEMPDVDTLGLYHTLFDDWRSYVAPVPPSRHEELYGKLGKAFVAAKHHRELREALAASYLRGSAVPRDAYQPNALAFNALWEEKAGVPEDLRADLPEADGWKAYLEALAERQKDRAFVAAGQNRMAWIDAERARVRATLVRVLDEFGALERRAKPEPKPRPKPVDEER